MEVSDLMKSPVVTIAPTATLVDAARLLAGKKIGCLPVCEEAAVIGMLTDRDIVAAIAAGKDVGKATCCEVMSKTVVSCAPGDSVEEATRAMDRGGVHHLPVLEAGKIVGVLAVGDLAVSLMFQNSGPPPGMDLDSGMGEMTPGIPEPTLADEVLRVVGRDAWR